MKPITFFDTEVELKSKKVLDFGSVKENLAFTNIKNDTQKMSFFFN